MGGVGDELVGSAPHPLGRLPVGVLAEGCLQAGMDGVQVDAEGDQQLAVAGYAIDPSEEVSTLSTCCLSRGRWLLEST